MTSAGPELTEETFLDGSLYWLLLRQDHRIASSPLNRLHSKKKLSYRKILVTVFLLPAEGESVLSSNLLLVFHLYTNLVEGTGYLHYTKM